MDSQCAAYSRNRSFRTSHPPPHLRAEPLTMPVHVCHIVPHAKADHANAGSLMHFSLSSILMQNTFAHRLECFNCGNDVRFQGIMQVEIKNAVYTVRP